jgi:hypothetical protein
MTTPAAPAPEPTPAPRHGPVAWLEEHVVPGLRTALADAEKARVLIPRLEAFLPKISAAAQADPAVAGKLGELVTEGEEILEFITRL